MVLSIKVRRNFHQLHPQVTFSFQYFEVLEVWLDLFLLLSMYCLLFPVPVLFVFPVVVISFSLVSLLL
jgi:hypothetical protein